MQAEKPCVWRLHDQLYETHLKISILGGKSLSRLARGLPPELESDPRPLAGLGPIFSSSLFARYSFASCSFLSADTPGSNYNVRESILAVALAGITCELGLALLADAFVRSTCAGVEGFGSSIQLELFEMEDDLANLRSARW